MAEIFPEVCALKEGFKRVFDPNFRKPFPKTCQWYLGRIGKGEVRRHARQFFSVEGCQISSLGLNLDSSMHSVKVC